MSAPATGDEWRGTGPARIEACPDGPLLVRGDVEIVDDAGAAIPRHRRTVALCRCGASGIKPWCDGTHKLARFRTEAPPDTPPEPAA